MTNLKGIATHETRQCLYHDPLVTQPFLERGFTILVFISGAVFFSVIYGNIAQAIQSLYAAGLRYRQRVEELSEFARFHRLSPSLRAKLINYVDFQWSVTNGIDVDTIASVNGLPAHLQLEMKLQLNKHLVEQVSIFAGCPRAFYEALVCKLQSCVCVAQDFVFYQGEMGSNMYFLKRGEAEACHPDGFVFASFREGDYFGELSLLTDAPRTCDVRAVTDLVMLSLSLEDLNEVLDVYPQAQARIHASAVERLKKIEKQDEDRVKKEAGESGSFKDSDAEAPAPSGGSFLTKFRRRSSTGESTIGNFMRSGSISDQGKRERTRDGSVAGLAAGTSPDLKEGSFKGNSKKAKAEQAQAANRLMRTKSANAGAVNWDKIKDGMSREGSRMNSRKNSIIGAIGGSSSRRGSVAAKPAPRRGSVGDISGPRRGSVSDPAGANAVLDWAHENYQPKPSASGRRGSVQPEMPAIFKQQAGYRSNRTSMDLDEELHLAADEGGTPVRKFNPCEGCETSAGPSPQKKMVTPTWDDDQHQDGGNGKAPVAPQDSRRCGRRGSTTLPAGGAARQDIYQVVQKPRRTSKEEQSPSGEREHERSCATPPYHKNRPRRSQRKIWSSQRRQRMKDRPNSLTRWAKETLTRCERCSRAASPPAC